MKIEVHIYHHYPISFESSRALSDLIAKWESRFLRDLSDQMRVLTAYVDGAAGRVIARLIERTPDPLPMQRNRLR